MTSEVAPRSLADVCGIAGHVSSLDSPDHEAVLRATQKLIHRGPDDSGFARFAHASLGHRRLNIIEPDSNQQPLSSNDGRFTIVFNGEIYNYVELRESMEKSGVRFATDGDTEVLLRMYQERGPLCLSALNGMFAFAVWDNEEGSLFMARDRMGKKPLYYSVFGNSLVFASEASALLEFPEIRSNISEAALDDYLAHQCVGREASVFSSVRQVAPGHYLEFGKDGSLSLKSYWSVPTAPPREDRGRDWEEDLRCLMRDAVRIRLRSDVPLGVFLSGGIDSAIVASVASELSDNTLDSISIGFQDASFDESPWASEMSRHLGTRHHHLMVECSSESFESFVDDLDEPFADPSAFPTWHLCRFARENVTVALSGDGADELFGGYSRYRAADWVRRFPVLNSAPCRSLIASVAGVLPDRDVYYGASIAKRLRLFDRWLTALTDSPQDLSPQLFSHRERSRLLRIGRSDGRALSQTDFDGLDLVERSMRSDLKTYLANDILVKIDRMSMAHSLEVRSPFLDPGIVEFACALPLDWKIRRQAQKVILREAFGDQLPNSIRMRGKHGFAPPVGRWLRGPLRDLFFANVLETPLPQLQESEVTRYWSEHSSGDVDHGIRLWALLVLHTWVRRRRELPSLENGVES